MKTIPFGIGGLKVSELCLGTLTFGDGPVMQGVDYFGSGARESQKIFDLFCSAGGYFIDTSDYYGGGVSEKLVGDFIRSDRSHFVVGTKYSLSGPFNQPVVNNSRENMVRCLEGSLKRLGTDYIDIYWVHKLDGATPIEEVLQGLEDLMRSGKIRYCGICNAAAWKVSQANTIADIHGWRSFAGIQIAYNLAGRQAEVEQLPMANEQGIGVAVYGVLGRGGLSLERQDAPICWPPQKERNKGVQEARDVLSELSQDIGCTSSQLALAAILRNKRNGNIVPIIGARKLNHMKENLGCLNVSLSDDQMRILFPT